jgi:hypothetical protein
LRLNASCNNGARSSGIAGAIAEVEGECAAADEGLSLALMTVGQVIAESTENNQWYVGGDGTGRMKQKLEVFELIGNEKLIRNTKSASSYAKINILNKQVQFQYIVFWYFNLAFSTIWTQAVKISQFSETIETTSATQIKFRSTR